MKDQFPVDCDVSEYEGSYGMTRAKFAKQLAQDFAADEEEGEEEDDGEASQEDEEEVATVPDGYEEAHLKG